MLNPNHPRNDEIIRAQTVPLDIYCYPDEWMNFTQIEELFFNLGQMIQSAVMFKGPEAKQFSDQLMNPKDDAMGNWLIAGAINHCLNKLTDEHRYLCLWQYDAPVSSPTYVAEAIDLLEKNRVAAVGLAPPVCNAQLNFPIRLYQWILLKREILHRPDYFTLLAAYKFKQIYVPWIREMIIAHPQSYDHKTGPILNIGESHVEHSPESMTLCILCRLEIKEMCGVCGGNHHRNCGHYVDGKATLEVKI